MEARLFAADAHAKYALFPRARGPRSMRIGPDRPPPRARGTHLRDLTYLSSAHTGRFSLARRESVGRRRPPVARAAVQDLAGGTIQWCIRELAFRSRLLSNERKCASLVLVPPMTNLPSRATRQRASAARRALEKSPLAPRCWKFSSSTLTGHHG